MPRTYDDWKTTDPRDAQEPDRPERDPDADRDDYMDEQLARKAVAADENEPNWRETEMATADRTLTRQQLDQIFDILRDIEARLDEKADVDDRIPNEAMRLLVGVRDVIRKLEGR